jgi:branched-chain amino acid transport system substrate-binding protein
MTVRKLGCLLAVSLVLFAGCGDDGQGTAPDDASDSVPAANPEELLGEPNPASGTPVKVGLITDGGECAECSEEAGFEEPTAEATAEWANEYLGGLAGRPIEIVTCVDDLDAGKATDCANQMIADEVVAVVIGASGVIETSWNVLHGAGIPVVNFGVTQEALLDDEASTFILQDSDAMTVNLPLDFAVDAGVEKVSVIVVNLPIAYEGYEGDTPDRFEDAGVELDVVPVDLGTPDMTPQAQQVVSDNPDGVVMVVGHDQFCIPAINGLIAAGFDGTILTISHCVTDAARDALPADVLEGMVIAATAPLGDDEDPSMQLYNVVLDTYGASEVRRDSATPLSIYSSIAALSLGTQGLEGEVTPQSIIAALRAMENEVLPGTGGRLFRCNGEAAPAPASCMGSALSATLDAEGNAVDYEVLGNEPIDG